MFPVKSLENGLWHDSAKGVTREVSEGDLVQFQERRDAEHFVSLGRAEWAFDSNEQPAKPAKPAKKSKKAKADAQAETSE